MMKFSEEYSNREPLFLLLVTLQDTLRVILVIVLWMASPIKSRSLKRYSAIDTLFFLWSCSTIATYRT